MTRIWPKREHSDWSHLLRDRGSLGDLPSEVRCLCIACWGDTLCGHERCTIGIDVSPRWTNTIPPKYVERRWLCYNCEGRRRFIPIEKIPSIPEEDVRELYHLNRGFDEKVQLQMLQEQRPASRYHRWQKPAAKSASNANEPCPKKHKDVPTLLDSKHLEFREGSVPTECIRCHREADVDYHPQWFIGTDVYLARLWTKCQSKGCLQKSRHRIPMDKGIHYMSQQTFRKHATKGDFDSEAESPLARLKHRQNRIGA